MGRIRSLALASSNRPRRRRPSSSAVSRRPQRNIEELLRSAVIFYRDELPRSPTEHENVHGEGARTQTRNNASKRDAFPIVVVLRRRPFSRRHQRNIEGLLRSAVIFYRSELPRSPTDHANVDGEGGEDADKE